MAGSTWTTCPSIRMLQILLFSAALLTQDPQTVGTVRMPPLVGNSLDVARQLLERNQLLLGQVDSVATIDPPHTVLRQSVPPGLAVGIRTRINLLISFRERQPDDVETPAPPVVVIDSVRVPDLVDSTLVAAVMTLGRLRLLSGEIGYVERAGNTGVVVFQSPSPGTLVPQGTRVSITLSTRIRFLRIPPVVDSSVVRARVILRDAGLEVGRIVASDDARPPGTVVRQLPAAGDSAPPGFAVALWVARRRPAEGNESPATDVIPAQPEDTAVTVPADTGDTTDPEPESKAVWRSWPILLVVGGATAVLAVLASLGWFTGSPPRRPSKPPQAPPPTVPTVTLQPHRDPGHSEVSSNEPASSGGAQLRVVVDPGVHTIDANQRVTQEEVS